MVQPLSRSAWQPEGRCINYGLHFEAMKPPIDFSALRARMVALRDPRGPVDHQLPNSVTLTAPISDRERDALWHDAQDWCYQNVHHSYGDQWSRRCDRDTRAFVFSFTNFTTATLFKLTFG